MSSVLIIEDEKRLNDAYCYILESHGYKAVPAYDGQQALDVIKKDKPDVVLLDMKMPKMSGLEFLKNLQKNNISLNIVIFSNEEDQSDIEAAYSLGAQRYIVKSWASPKDLVRVVEDALM